MIHYPADPASPQSVIEAFIHAMNVWEAECALLSRQLREDPDRQIFWSTVKERLVEIHRAFLTPRRRVYASAPTFQRPPAYDPQKERVLSVSVDSKTAYVETHRACVLGGGRYRYRLLSVSNRWLIDSVKHWCDDHWERHTL